MNKTQKVAKYLEEHGSITSWEAIQLFRATRLSAIILTLRRRGMHIDSAWEKNEDSRWVRYILITENGESLRAS